MLDNAKVLVTGGTGLVGRELVELLVGEGAIVTSVSLDEDNLDPAWDVRHYQLDLRDPVYCQQVVSGQDYVFHIAGIKGSPIITKTYQYKFFTDLLQLNTSMIDAMYKSSSMIWGLYTSTIGTYGPADIFNENDLWNQNPSPNDWYAGWAKRMGEVQVDAHTEQYGERKISIIKPANIYGKYDNFDLRTSTLVPSLIRKVAESQDQVTIWGDGSAGRDIIHARDVARAAILAMQCNIIEPLNVGSGTCSTIKSVIHTLVDISGKNLCIEHDLSKPTGDQNRVPNIHRLLRYGFKHSVPLYDGLKETYEWYVKNGPTQGRYQPFL